MTLDNMTGITKGSYTGGDMFCKSQLITCNRVKECNGVCPFEDALKHADKMQIMNEQHTVDHDREWIIGCIQHDGFIHTHRFDEANQIILEALKARPSDGDLISRQDALNAFWKLNIELKPSVIDVIDDMLRDLPSARPTGEWIPFDNHYKCDQCGFEPVYEKTIKSIRFCPHCGTEMEVEHDSV